jgi:hypothetical protein
VSKSKRKFLGILAIVLAAANLSMVAADGRDILSDADLAMEQMQSDSGPALSSALDQEPYWESYNEWKCFRTNGIELLYCAEIDDGRSQLPTLRVSDEGATLYELSLDPEPGLSCEVSLNQWRELVRDQHNFCVFAAYLQDINHGHELWIIDTLKSLRGSWKWQNAAVDDSGEEL